MEDLSHYNPEGSVLRKAQIRMLEMLDIFDGICRKHNINYWLVCGTLLGARRHGGFIPWDDDLDIAILQKDYKKLISILNKELPNNLVLQSRETDKKYWYYYPRIRDTRSKVYNKRRDFEYEGIFIDIFTLEPIPSIKLKKTIDKFLFSEIHFKKAKSLLNKIKYGAMLFFTPLVHLLIRFIRFYYRYLGNTKKYTYSFGTFFYPTYNIGNFYPISEIMFEGKKYKAPYNIDKYLTENFDANFMVIPQPEKRTKHSTRIDFL